VRRFTYRTTTRVVIEGQPRGIAVNTALHVTGLAAGRLDFNGPVVHRRDRHGDACGLANIGAELNPATVALDPMTQVYVGKQRFRPGRRRPGAGDCDRAQDANQDRDHPSSAIDVTSVAFDPRMPTAPVVNGGDNTGPVVDAASKT
jgi:hypothetical protein